MKNRDENLEVQQSTDWGLAAASWVCVHAMACCGVPDQDSSKSRASELRPPDPFIGGSLDTL